MATTNVINQMVKVSGMTDMEFVNDGNTIICREDDAIITVNSGYVSAISLTKKEDNMSSKSIKFNKGNIMSNDTSIFGPQRYCTCHNGVTEELLQETMDQLGVEYADENSITQGMAEELSGSYTKLEQCDDGFVCPVCGEIYDMSDDVMDGHIDGAAFMGAEDRPNFSPFDVEDIKSCRSISLITNDYTNLDELKADIINACKGDIFLAESVAEFVINVKDIDKDSEDGIGRSMVSYVEELMGEDYNDDGELVKSNHTNMIDVEDAANKLIPWLGETVNILGMTDIYNKSNDKVMDGAWSKYYKTNHSKLAKIIREKATLAKDNIMALLTKKVDDETVISEFDAKHLINELTYEYDYWMAWANDDMWNGFKIHQYLRSNCLDYVGAGGTLKYYQYTNKDNKITFGYHPDSYSMDVKYVDGSINLVAEVKHSDTINVLASKLAENSNNWWSAYKFNGQWFIDAMIFDGDDSIVAFHGKATTEIADFCRSFKATHITNNTYDIIKNTVVKVNYKFYYFTNDLINIFDIKGPATLSKQAPSNKWICDNTFLGKDVIGSGANIRYINDYTEEESSDSSSNNCYPIDNRNISQLLYGHTSKMWITLKSKI